MEKYDLVIVGGGILGTSIAYWLSRLYDSEIAVIEAEPHVALHTSGRNTGVLHRPFYLDPQKKKIFAACAQTSFALWKKFAQSFSLPWKEVGTLEVATTNEEVKVLEKYLRWAGENGMKEEEIEFLTASEVSSLEPKVRCAGALHIKTDTSVDFRAFSEHLYQEARAQGMKFIFNFEVSRVDFLGDAVRFVDAKRTRTIETKFLINCAGGNAVDLAHLFGAGKEYTDLHFRGEYWEIHPARAHLANRNIYSVPRFSELPFLDPHWICRADGRRAIGPNAVLVAGSQTYEGFASSFSELFKKIVEPPLQNKFRLFTDPEFLALCISEWKSSFSKKELVRRVQRFLPELKAEDLLCRGAAGIRSSVIDGQGKFVREALEIPAPFSYHILNYNSPGATGAPAYAVYLLDKLIPSACFAHLKKRKAEKEGIWNFEEVAEQLN